MKPGDPKLGQAQARLRAIAQAMDQMNCNNLALGTPAWESIKESEAQWKSAVKTRFAEGGAVGGECTSCINGALAGMTGSFADSFARMPAFAAGGGIGGVRGNSTPAALSHHELDIRTNAGNFTARVDEDTMEAIRSSSLGGKLSMTGQRPTWYS